MRKLAIYLILICSFQSAISQEFELVRHQVQMGETVRMLSKRYKVEPSEIYRLNKFAVDGISQGMVLQLLVPKKEKPVIQKEILEDDPQVDNGNASDSSGSLESNPAIEIQHTVTPKETLYSLSKKYNVSVDDIKRLNEKKLAKGLQTGQVLTIPGQN